MTATPEHTIHPPVAAEVPACASASATASRYAVFDRCPQCEGEMRPEHAHYRCSQCGWRDSCCD